MADIGENFFEALEWYSMVVKSKKGDIKNEPIKNKSVVAMALDVQPNLEFKNKPQKCDLCDSSSLKSDHSLAKCNVYSTPKSKVDMLKKLNGCFKCGKVSHQLEICKFKLNLRINQLWQHHLEHKACSQKSGNVL